MISGGAATPPETSIAEGRENWKKEVHIWSEKQKKFLELVNRMMPHMSGLEQEKMLARAWRLCAASAHSTRSGRRPRSGPGREGGREMPLHKKRYARVKGLAYQIEPLEIEQKCGRKTARLYKILRFVTQHAGCNIWERIYALDALLSGYWAAKKEMEDGISDLEAVRDLLLERAWQRTIQPQENHE